jgi:hypothetical protein
MHITILAMSDPVIIALAVLVLVGAILITSIIRYKADDFVKFWAAAGTVIGLALGTVGTFFFTKGQVAQKESELRTTQTALQSSEKEKIAVGEQISQLAQSLNSNANPWAVKLKNISKSLTGEKPSSSELWNGGENPTLYASPAPSASPSPGKYLESPSEASPSPAAYFAPTSNNARGTEID